MSLCVTRSPNPQGPVQSPALPLAQAAGERARVLVSWARHLDDVREAQRLRHRVFAREMGARLLTTLPGYDVDRFDDYCEHLIARDGLQGRVIGTYRVLTPAQAARAGGGYMDGEFDLSVFRGIHGGLVELGRACVHPQHRHGTVLLAMWRALAQFLARNRLDVMVGCASLPLGGLGPQQLSAAAAACAPLMAQGHASRGSWRVRPRVPLPLTDVHAGPTLAAEPLPALVQGYLRLGARIEGPPALDADFGTADLPMSLHLGSMPGAYRRLLLRD